MDPKHRTLLINLTENQAKFLKPIFIQGTAASGASGLRGHGLGKVAATMHEAGFVVPMGRLGRQKKWELTSTWEYNWNKFRKEISDILNKISGD